MQFNSYLFILAFLPLCLIGYGGLHRIKAYAFAKWFLLLTSFVFYSWYNSKLVLFLAATVLVNYVAYWCILHKEKPWKQTAFVVGILLNLGALAYFKYANFFIENVNALCKTQWTLLHLALPLGVSFITFSQVAFLADAKRGETPEYALLDYAVFVAFFPKIISGPIALHDEMLPQFQQLGGGRSFDVEMFAKGLTAFALGLGKKVLLADTFAKAVSVGYAADIATLGALNAAIVIIGYTLQIYFDFSGYCDMASGVSMMLGFTLPVNFNSPYKALNILDFWKRWHMTLTRFLTRYIYIPLGGNRKGTLRTYINILLVYLVSGLWHGADWSFVVWGGMHGIGSIVCRAYREVIGKRAKAGQWGKGKKTRAKKACSAMGKAVCWLVTFLFVSFAWVYFRAPNIETGTAMLKQLLNFEQLTISPDMIDSFVLTEFSMMLIILRLTKYKATIMAGFFLISFIILLGMKNTQEITASLKPSLFYALVAAVLLGWCILSFSGVSEFVYGAF